MRSIRTPLLGALVAALLALASLTATPASATQTQTPTEAHTRAQTQTTLATSDPAPATSFVLPIAAKTYYLSSHFGPRCIPVQGGSTYHYGVDLAAPGRTPIHSIAAGVVTATVSGTSSQAGYISVRHLIDGVQYTSVYMHIWSATTHVSVGQSVAAGQRISEVGSSGVSSGNHLHLELWKAASTGSEAQNAASFLQPRGVDLYASAIAVTAAPTPATCTYYAVVALNFRTGPSTTSPIIRVLAQGTAMSHVPGTISGSFIPVRVGTESGWVSAAYVSPTKPQPPATYVTTAPLRLRAAPSTTATTILIIPQGANVGPILATSGDWRQVTYAGRTGWVHSAYLVKR
ncbi:peptidoglycan DD-metalloendopeptidase family protein [Microbacterium sp. BK668]|uniref:peptidoglycan DD-metalloendopeptidase family protein n=1 Tax=Microbacterium sp. BK668 TaxID=2512118 RepID=UPI001060EE21|nr:peptidoglycan DD-metalloendopeptidase family protein [Microbacterium sp. BK668]TDN88569.1 SH3 domain-containing protein [Microbacterium sp. BK668]